MAAAPPLVPFLFVITLSAFLNFYHIPVGGGGAAAAASTSALSAQWNFSSSDPSLNILVSDNGHYAWKFYADRFNSTRRYLTVMSTLYNGTIVWTANRDRPVSANATLYLQQGSRRLVLQDSDGFVAWSFNSSEAIGWAHMNDTGNLLLMSSGRDLVLWRSFDHPTDTFLPGQILRTGNSMWSSLSWESLARGSFTLTAEPGGAVLYASLDDTSGGGKVPYQILNYFTLNDTFQAIFHSVCNRTEIVYAADSNSVALQQQGDQPTPECAAANPGVNSVHSVEFGVRKAGEGFRFLRLDPDGNLRTYFQSNQTGLEVDNDMFAGMFRDSCKIPEYCGSYGLCSQVGTQGANCSCPEPAADFRALNPSDLRQGCALVSPLQNCSTSTNATASTQYQMVNLQGVDYYANTYLDPTAYTINADACRTSCLSNCSCAGSFFDNTTGACFQYTKIHSMQYNSQSTVTAFLKVKASPQHKKSLKHLIVSVSTAVSAFLVVAVLAVGMIVRILILSRRSSEEDSFLDSLPGLPPRFYYKDLQAATQNFSSSLGRGASGSVFHGVLRDSTEVAVKQLQIGEFHGSNQFRAEVATLGNINHINLVQLRGFCAEGPHRLLVYDYMSNGSLDRWIFARDPTEEPLPSLSCAARYKIAVDTARGLAFLHEESREPVMHLDVKPQNVLLDGAFNAKLADFGMSKLMHRGQSRTMTAMRGTPGYMAPEWFLNMPITPKSDVFSYGMMLLELVGGRKNLVLSVATDEWFFPAWAVQHAEVGRVMEVVDRQLLLESAGDHDKIQRLLDVAFWCIQDDATVRPAMTTVLLMLEGHLDVPDPPLDMTHGTRNKIHP